ncbi:MAG TPA: glycogen/starch/alpha-glucan phosphorylase [Actinomycetota bacterium]|nr:glycogen/starch/alpha-glucan phosphorylase [Actinomycetota bacterium]
MAHGRHPGAHLQDPEKFAREFTEELRYGQGVDINRAHDTDLYMALAHTVRQALISRWIDTLGSYWMGGGRGVVYLSAEYLLGRQLDNALLATNLQATARHALMSLGLDLDLLRETEVEPGLGNGGLGRLAACFLDSLATMSIPAVGYGIRYEYGIFQQTFNEEGRQVEVPDSWLRSGNPWEFPHPEMSATVGFGGTVTHPVPGKEKAIWEPATKVVAVPYNYMVPGYRSDAVNTLRLWRAQASQNLDLKEFNAGDFQAAVRAQTEAEAISKVLYPEDSTPAGKRLRLQQQYFFVAASIHDVIHNVLPGDFDLRRLPERVIFQLNDTHPVIAVPELMRVLIDGHGLGWEEAWGVTRQCFAYTCHTLLPEALEVWPVELLEDLLPRHMEIIYEINLRFLKEVADAFPENDWRVRRMSIIEEHPVRSVRMAYLATVASSKVNGVAELHSRLLRERVLPDFAELYPDRFTNVTNGVTPRRFLKLANPELSALITYKIGSDWVTDLEQLRGLDEFVDDPKFLSAVGRIKRENKERLAELLKRQHGILLNVDTMFDAMVKRMHEYKRQVLKLLHVVVLHQRLLDGENITPRTVIFGAKAAPGYAMAKDTIALINSVSRTIDADPRARGKLAVVFPANYNVTLAETLIPAADLSEQISLAGKEASGTGNMKFALNGALTVGTLDGANIEIRELVGPDNFFLFGMTEEQAHATQEAGYAPLTYFENDPVLRRALEALSRGDYSDGEKFAFGHVVDSLLSHDPYMVMADFASYIAVQDEVDRVWADPDQWNRMVVHNIARSGFFSSDRSIQDYLDRIWHAPRTPVHE